MNQPEMSVDEMIAAEPLPQTQAERDEFALKLHQFSTRYRHSDEYAYYYMRMAARVIRSGVGA